MCPIFLAIFRLVISLVFDLAVPSGEFDAGVAENTSSSVDIDSVREGFGAGTGEAWGDRRGSFALMSVSEIAFDRFGRSLNLQNAAACHKS